MQMQQHFAGLATAGLATAGLATAELATEREGAAERDGTTEGQSPTCRKCQRHAKKTHWKSQDVYIILVNQTHTVNAHNPTKGTM